MMMKEDVDKFARRRPFEPFEIRLVDGQRYRFRRIEEFLVGRTSLARLRRDGTIEFISIGLISSIGPGTSRPGRRPRGRL